MATHEHILGISAYYHDSAACLLRDDEIVAAAQEERFTRKRHDAAFPVEAIRYCLGEAGIRVADLDHVVFYEKPLLKFRRLLATYFSMAPSGLPSFRVAMPLWLGKKVWQARTLSDELRKLGGGVGPRHPLRFVEHHQSHAAAAFFPSPFTDAAILTMDGVGEWATTSTAFGRGGRIEMREEIRFPHSLGMLYSAFTSFTGFKVLSGEYKVMGLAPYGQPRFAQTILDHLIDLKPDGSFRLDMDYFDFATGMQMTNERFARLFDGAPRLPDEDLTQREMDLAASIQVVTEEVVLRLARALVRETGTRRLCLAGGVALNCVANGKLLRDGCVDELWIQPAAGDAGSALGAAMMVRYQHLGRRRPRPVAASTGGDRMGGSYLGPAYADATIARELASCRAVLHRLDEDALLDAVVDALAAGKAVGWFQGRMEFGPRALGARSILGDPRSPSMQRTLNLKVKFRESFRPFAPSVLAEDVSDWFGLGRPSPYMLLVADVAAAHRRAMTDEENALFGIAKLNVPRSVIPAVTHVDYSARVQTVHRETNPRYHALLSRWKARTGCPVLVNTSFNVRGEPIVCTPTDAFRCFMGTGIEALAIGCLLLHKHEQDPALAADYRNAFEAD